MGGRRHIRVGRGSRILRGATILAKDGTVTIGDDALISRFAVVQSVGGSVHIGHRSGVGDFCNLYGQGVLTIGNDVLIASGVRIHTAEHNFEGRDVAIRSQGETVASTVIGDGAWLGANVVIVAGVHVGDGAVVAAGAVVTQDVAAYTVVGGVPARLLKRRPSEGCA